MEHDIEIIGPNLEIVLSGRHMFALRNLENGMLAPIRGYHDEPVKNLITDVGLNSCFARSFCASRNYLVLGTGTTAASTTDTTLATYYAVSTKKSLTENGVTVNAASKYVEDYATHTWANSTGSSKTISEVGMSWQSSSNPNVFSRVVLPSAITVPNGYELIDKYILRKSVPAWRTVSTPSITVNGISQSGRAMLVGHDTYANDTTLIPNLDNGTYNSFALFRTTGDIIEPDISYGLAVCEPCSISSNNNQRASLFTSATAYASMTATDNFTQPTLYNYAAMTLGTYTAGSFTNTKHYSFLASTLPGQSFYGFTIGNVYYCPHFIFRADAPFTKNPTSTYHIGLRTTLARA